MITRSKGFAFLGPIVFLGACASSHAEPIAISADDRSGDERPIAERYDPPAAATRGYEAPPPSTYPYDVEVTDGAGRPLRTFASRGRWYVLGSVGERYRLHVTNHSSRRVEAVVSIDGLDAVDGRSADFVHKRGYLIPAYGDVTVDGFRTSLDDVATFRFSSVRDSYAGRKGEDRNVGVIGVAFFPERPRPAPRPVYMPRPSAPEDGYGERAATGAPGQSGAARKAEAAPASPPPASRSAEGGASAPSATADSARDRSEDRPGLGTEFGERRGSRAAFTKFERESASSPAAVVELHYDDRAGLLAVGIPVDEAYPRVSDADLRETADPFPQSRFAAPPPRR